MRLKLLHVLIATYFIFLFMNINPQYLDADEGSHAMTSVFFQRLIIDWFQNPTVSPGSVYGYAKSYYVHYPKFSFIYGPLFPLISGFIFLFTGPSVIILRIIEVILSTASLIIFYYALKNLWDERVSLLATLLLGTSSLFINYSLKVMLDIPCFFFFITGFYFFTKALKILSFGAKAKVLRAHKKTRKQFFLAGLFLGLSILTKEIALIFTLGLVITALINYKRIKVVGLLSMILGVLVFTIPYFIFLYFTQGGLDVILSYPLRQAYYGAQSNDPQWYEPLGWIYFLLITTENFSIIFTIALLLSIYYLIKKRDVLNNLLITLFFITYLSITLINDKNPKLMLLGLGYCAIIVSLGLNKFFKHYRKNNYRFMTLFIAVLIIVIGIPFNHSMPVIPMAEVAMELINNCPNCTVLVASETGMVYSSYLMYESLIKDENASLRFLRPTAFSSMNAMELINNEAVNRIIVIGDYEFLKSSDEVSSYLHNVEYIINKYDLISVHDSDLVGKIFIYDTKINETRNPPYCVTALGINKGFCTDYYNPIDALKNL